MDITIRGDNLAISEALQTFATRKLSRLNRYMPNIMDVHVEFAHQRTRRGENQSIAQITIRHTRGAIIRAEESVDGDNLQGALVKALDNMYRRIERFKGKQTRKGKTRFSMSIEELEAAEEIPEEELEVATADASVQTAAPDEIIRRKSVDLVTMTEDEAVEQLELLGHTFFMFFNESTMSVNVLYKRNEGGYGVLVPNLV